MTGELVTERTPFIEVAGLHKTFLHEQKEILVLRGLDLNLDEGDMISVTGASGAGKTTLLQVLGTLDEPTQGIDIGAKVALFHLINEITAQNKGIIFISSDHDELLAMSDRIGIVRNGSIVQIAEAKQLRHEDLVQSTVEAPFTEDLDTCVLPESKAV